MTAFGTVFLPEMPLITFDGEQWSPISMVPSDSISLHPGAHVLHYASTCFEGLKAFKHRDGSVRLFRPECNAARMVQSSTMLHLPPVSSDTLLTMFKQVVKQYANDIPEPPGSFYLRPTHFGTEAAVGKAVAPSASSMLYVLVSPVGDYFDPNAKPMSVYVDESLMRCAPHMGMIKGGSNYASCLGLNLKAQQEHGAKMVLFAPGGDVQETGAANFMLMDDKTLITKDLDSTFLHGITRDSLLTLARDRGMTVEERSFTVEEMLDFIKRPNAEAALSGTAAVLAPVGSIIHNGETHAVGSGDFGPITQGLRQTLNDIQWGVAPDEHGWLMAVG